MKTKAVLYTRIRNDEEFDDEKFLNELNKPEFEIVASYVDVDSDGSTFIRPAFCQMIKNLIGGEASVIIVPKVHKFSRNSVATCHLLKDLKEKGIFVYFADIKMDSSVIDLEKFTETLIKVTDAFGEVPPEDELLVEESNMLDYIANYQVAEIDKVEEA